MAEQDAQQQHSRSQLASTWPDPPPFWKDFTTENREAIGKLRASAAETREGATETTSSGPGEGLQTRIPGIPEQLINLQPPPEPADGKWRVFGDLYTLDEKLPSLEEQGIRRLTSTSTASPAPDASAITAATTKHLDRAFQLKRLAKSLLLSFLELLGILSADATQAGPKIDALRTLFINFHHVLNEYRPHQARESLMALMQDRLDRTRQETAAVRAAVDRARREIEGLGSITIATTSETRKDEPPKKRTEGDNGDEEVDLGRREDEAWAEVDGML